MSAYRTPGKVAPASTCHDCGTPDGTHPWGDHHYCVDCFFGRRPSVLQMMDDAIDAHPKRQRLAMSKRAIRAYFAEVRSMGFGVEPTRDQHRGRTITTVTGPGWEGVRVEAWHGIGR